MSPAVCECRFCGDNLNPQGIDTHERFCDDNPNPGVSYAQQEDLGLFEDEETEGSESPTNPDQSVSAGDSSSLPSLETLSPDKNHPENARSDGGTPRECPNCGNTEVVSASKAREEYIGEVENPNGKAVVGYQLAEWACNAPECATLWGDKYAKPLTMKEVVEA